MPPRQSQAEPLDGSIGLTGRGGEGGEGGRASEPPSRARAQRGLTAWNEP